MIIQVCDRKNIQRICSKLVVLEEFPLKIMLFVRQRKNQQSCTKHKHKIQAARTHLDKQPFRSESLPPRNLKVNYKIIFCWRTHKINKGSSLQQTTYSLARSFAFSFRIHTCMMCGVCIGGINKSCYTSSSCVTYLCCLLLFMRKQMHPFQAARDTLLSLLKHIAGEIGKSRGSRAQDFLTLSTRKLACINITWH